jgi:hypothetical protein
VNILFSLAYRIHMDVFNLWYLWTCFHMWIFYVVFLMKLRRLLVLFVGMKTE